MSEEALNKVEALTGIRLIALQKWQAFLIIVGILASVAIAWGSTVNDTKSNTKRIDVLEQKYDENTKDYNKTLIEISVQLSELKTEIRNLKGK